MASTTTPVEQRREMVSLESVKEFMNVDFRKLTTELKEFKTDFQKVET